MVRRNSGKVAVRDDLDAARGIVRAVFGGIAIIIFCLAFAALPAFATPPDNRPPDNRPPDRGGNQEQDQSQEQHQGQAQGQHQGQEQYAEGGDGGDATGGAAFAHATGGEADATAMSGANNEGIDIDASDHSENNNTNVVLVPNNNTESCLRVWGISFGNSDGAGGIGIPWRSKKCDYEQAADDAFAAGERELGWFWKCQNPNLYRSFKDKGESKEQAQQDCHARMVGGVTALRTIETLREELTFEREERLIERDQSREMRERLELACEESKDRILEACVSK